MPPAGARPLVEAFSASGGLVLNLFAGSGSTLRAAKKLGRDSLGIELDAEYHATAGARLAYDAGPTARIGALRVASR